MFDRLQKRGKLAAFKRQIERARDLQAAAKLESWRLAALAKQAERLTSTTRTLRFRCARLVILLLLYIFFGGLVFSATEGWGFAKGIYFATVTMTTVGFGDIVPAGDGARAFTVLFALLGIVFLSTEAVSLLLRLKELAMARVCIWAYGHMGIWACGHVGMWACA